MWNLQFSTIAGLIGGIFLDLPQRCLLPVPKPILMTRAPMPSAVEAMPQFFFKESEHCSSDAHFIQPNKISNGLRGCSHKGSWMLVESSNSISKWVPLLV